MTAVDRLWRKIFEKRFKNGGFSIVRSKVERFRDLLAANCRAMELIADAGEKLGGEYIFDMQYLRTLASDLEETVRKIVHNLNEMTGDRYLELVDSFDRIRHEVHAYLEGGQGEQAGTIVLPISSVSMDHCDIVGEKMARLGELYSHFPSLVPPGFAVCATACRRMFEENGVLRLADSLLGGTSHSDQHLENACRRLQESVRAAKIPAEIAKEITKAVASVVGTRSRRSPENLLAVRSSALGEDGELSFAGLYKTLLNVCPEEALDAYKEVVASLFSFRSLVYRRDHNVSPEHMYMGVGFLAMVPAVTSGVIYTVDPNDPQSDRILVTAAPGYGKSVVDGDHQVDRFEISRNDPHRLIARSISNKESMYVADSGHGLRSVSLPEKNRRRACISDEDLFRLAEIALRIERFMKCAQDIEWAQDSSGRIFILQSRPLRLICSQEQVIERVIGITDKYPVVFKGHGEIACRGIGAGRVCVVRSAEERSHFFDGAVLVCKHASPQLSSLVSRASALITDVGAATGHLATIAREYRVPALVDTSVATALLHDGMEITVDAEENVVYEGIIPELLQYQLLRSSTYNDAFEFKLLRRLLKKIAPLNLDDPDSSNFRPELCSTYHDIIRFAHEKAVMELASNRMVKVTHHLPCCKQIKLPIPLDLLLIDVDTLADSSENRVIEPEKITCRPLRAILEGLCAPGVWATEPAEMDLQSFMSSAMSPMTADLPATATPECNVAIVSHEYLNLSLRLGYHFNVIDCYMSQTREDNYIYFRFVGGMTELTRRSRRTKLIARILEQHDFVTDTKGDLVIGRVKNLPEEMMWSTLSMIGRLIGFTRQLDTFLKSDDLVDHYAKRFLSIKQPSVKGQPDTADLRL